MSKYTTEVRWFCESKYNGENPEDIDAVIHATYPYILKPKLLNEIFDATYYPIIAEKIIRHYYFREIGAETIGLWIYWMNTRFSELLPYYNKLWESALLEFDPFKDVDYTREGNKQGLNSEVSNGRNTETLNGGASETTTESASEQGKGETAETGKSTDNRSESERGNALPRLRPRHRDDHRKPASADGEPGRGEGPRFALRRDSVINKKQARVICGPVFLCSCFRTYSGLPRRCRLLRRPLPSGGSRSRRRG